MPKTKKNHKTLFVFIKLILFAVVLFLLYKQIREVDEKQWEDFHIMHPLAFVITLLLTIPNIGFAFLKWKLTLKTIGVKTEKRQRVQSFFAGVVTGMLTPNMLGNFIGRFYYFDRKYRIQITLFTLLSNFAQFIASITFGWIAVLILGGLLIFEDEDQFLIWIGLIMIAAYLIYFFIENFLVKLRKKKYLTEFHSILFSHRKYRFQLLGLSFARFLIFTTQFSLLLYVFGEEINLALITAIWQVYLFTMIAPSLFLGKIGVKESISLFVLGAIGINGYSILFSSLIIWLINSFLPTIIGVIVCKNETTE